MSDYHCVNDWRANPLGAFDAFIASDDYVKTSRRLGQGMPLGKSSQETYRAPFHRFCNWATEQGIDIFASPSEPAALTEERLLAFLDLPKTTTKIEGGKKVWVPVFDKHGHDVKRLNSGARYQFVRVLSRIYEHLNIAGSAAAALADLPPAALGTNDQMTHLTQRERAQFVAKLPIVMLSNRPGSKGYQPSRPPWQGWKRIRDRALLLLIASAGLRQSEAIALELDQVVKRDTLDAQRGMVINYVVRITRHNVTRELALSSEDSYEMRLWLIARRWIDRRERRRGHTGFHPNLVFPPKLTYRESRPSRKSPTLEGTTVWRRICTIFKAAEIDCKHKGSRVLRNTFAVGLLAHNVPPEAVQERLGLVERRSLDRYKVGKDSGTGPRDPRAAVEETGDDA